MPRALISVSDKRGVVDLGRGLVARGFELVSTGGTARALTEVGLSVTNVSDVTGLPELMNGRVKTLHPALHGGILARRHRRDDLVAIERLGIRLVDVVVVNLYPFVEAAADLTTPFDALVEEIDIGGPSLVRAAAKNFQDVLVVVDPADYPRLLEELGATPRLSFRFDLARKAFAHTAAYDRAVTDALNGVRLERDRFVRGATEPPSGAGAATGTTNGAGATTAPEASGLDLAGRLEGSLEKIRDLRYGENPHQRAAWYRVTASGFERGGLGAAIILQGKELSYTNLLDLDAAARIVLEFDRPAAAVVKHTNPCGVAVADASVEAYVRARDADARAAFGGIVALNRLLDRPTAEAIVSTFIEAVVVPGVDDAAREILARKTNLRVVAADFGSFRSTGWELRTVLGAALLQERDFVAEARQPWATASPDVLRVVTRRHPSNEEWEALRFAWRVCAHVKSNAVIFTDATRTLAIGAGQMSRVDAVKVAIMKAGERGTPALEGSVAASDAFFPFRDGLDAVASVGARAVVQPGGSVRDAEVIAAADEHRLAMVFTGRRHFRH
jgi:phosphoribosylaminoimidazolecarboxamide formyltransferase/IMP cyclohydrolase